jgi:hypothetical protein
MTPELQLTPDQAELQLTPDLILRKALPFVPWAAFALLIAFLAGFVVGPHLAGEDRNAGLTIAIPPLPVVEPLTYRKATMVEARRVNATVPLTTSPIPAARPFMLYGNPADRERAIDCLAATIYYEAAAEAVEGQMAVVQVVLNRTRHPAYPKSICGVVFQGHERRTGCQFSYTCDGSMARRPSEELWKRFRGLARAMTNGMVYTPVGLATHYHTDWVLPAWSAKLDKVRVERTHLFFRYHGYWGSPKAFSGRYTGAEPIFPKLGNLSPAHKTVDTPALELTLQPEAVTLPDLAEIAQTPPDRVAEMIEPEAKGKEVFILYVDPLLEPDALKAMAQNACGALKRCKVLAWADPGLMPRGLPISPEERASMAFSYIRDQSAGRNTTAWNCALFPRDRKQDCL